VKKNNNQKNKDQIWQLKKLKGDEKKKFQFHKSFKIKQIIIKRKGIKDEEKNQLKGWFEKLEGRLENQGGEK